MDSTQIYKQEIYSKIVEQSVRHSKFITLVLKEGYRQGGTVKALTFPFLGDISTIKGDISLYEGVNYDFFETIDIYA